MYIIYMLHILIYIYIYIYIYLEYTYIVDQWWSMKSSWEWCKFISFTMIQTADSAGQTSVGSHITHLYSAGWGLGALAFAANLSRIPVSLDWFCWEKLQILPPDLMVKTMVSG